MGCRHPLFTTLPMHHNSYDSRARGSALNPRPRHQSISAVATHTALTTCCVWRASICGAVGAPGQQWLAGASSGWRAVWRAIMSMFLYIHAADPPRKNEQQLQHPVCPPPPAVPGAVSCRRGGARPHMAHDRPLFGGHALEGPVRRFRAGSYLMSTCLPTYSPVDAACYQLVSAINSNSPPHPTLSEGEACAYGCWHRWPGCFVAARADAACCAQPHRCPRAARVRNGADGAQGLQGAAASVPGAERLVVLGDERLVLGVAGGQRVLCTRTPTITGVMTHA